MSRLSLAYATLFTRDAAAVVDAAASAGFEAVGIRISGRNKTDQSYPDLIGKPDAIRHIRNAVRAGHLQLSNISTYHVSPEITLEDMAPVIETAAELGAETIVVNSTDPDKARREDFIARYCEDVAKAGLRLGLEFVPFSQVKTLEQGCELIASIGSPHIGLIIDSLHLGRSGGKPADIGNVDPKSIFMAQLCDASRDRPEGMDLPTEARTARLYPGDGGLPLRDFLLALPPDVPIDCEVPCARHLDLPLDQQAKQVAEICRRFIASVLGSSAVR